MKQLIYWIQQIHVAVRSIADSFSASVAPKEPITVGDITKLTKEQLDSLKPGDLVIKETGNQKHTYIVTYKGEGSGEGICITYTAAGYGETVSYDRTDSGWAFNSVDVKTYGE